MAMTTAILPRVGGVTASTTQSQLVPSNVGRNGLIIANLGAVTIFVGPSGVTLTTAGAAGSLSIAAGATLIFGGPAIPWVWTDLVNVITASSTAVVTFAEF